ncbi:MAG: dipeptidase [Deltaproteobacteria bacterium]|nr:dipeptidase [Deltaproteobacteria bacterium]
MEMNLTPEQEERAQQLHRESIVVDSTVLHHTIIEDKFFDRMKASGVDIAFVTTNAGTYEQTLDRLGKVLDTIHRRSDVMTPVRTAAEMRQAKARGKVGVLIAFQDLSPIGDDLQKLRIFYELGLRVAGLTYSGGNLIGDGCAERTREVRRLSFFGLEVVQEMNRLGIIPDLAHTGDATSEDTLEQSAPPVVFTHSNARTLADTTRNKPDHQIRAMAAKQGVMGVVAMPRTVCDDMSQADLPKLIDHVDYIANLVGVDHVGVGTDFTDARERFGNSMPSWWDAGTWRVLRPEMLGTVEDWYKYPYAKGFENMQGWPNLTRGLVARGYSDDEIRRILGGNWVRVLEFLETRTAK